MVSTILFGIPVYASQKDSSILQKYNLILEKLNEKYNTTLNISDDTDFYNNLLNISLEDFRSKMERDCLIAKSIEEEAITADNCIKIELNNNSEISTRSIRENIIQRSTKETSTYFIDVFMQSQVFSGNGKTYTYSKITKLGAYGHTDKAFFKPSNKSYSLSSDKKVCTANYTGTII